MNFQGMIKKLCTSVVFMISECDYVIRMVEFKAQVRVCQMKTEDFAKSTKVTSDSRPGAWVQAR